MIHTFNKDGKFHFVIKDVVIISKPEYTDEYTLSLLGDTTTHKVELRFENIAFYNSFCDYKNKCSLNKYRIGLFITTILSIFLLLKGL